MSELDRDARAFLASARGVHDPASGAKDRVRAGLAGTLAGAGAGAALASGAPVVRGTWIAGAKLAAIVGVGICGIGAALLFGRAPSEPPVAAVSIAAPLSPVERPVSPPPAGAGAGETTRASVSSNAAPGTAAPTTHVVVSAAASLSAGTDRTDRPGSRSAPLVAEVEASSLPRAPSLPTARSAGSHASAGEGSVEAEVGILRRASAALRAGDPKGALAAVREHARRFPHGALAEEREVERIVALCALGRTDDAARMTARFEQSYPSSSHEGRIRGACGAAPGVTP